MNRRNSLKSLMMASGALISLPSWAEGWTLDKLILGQSSFSMEEQDLLTSVADTIIPAGNSIGALSVGVDKFLQKLFQDCYEKDVQANIKNHLLKLDKNSQSANGKGFSACDQQQRQELLLKFSSSEDKAEKDFFDLVKSETIRGFNTSKEVMLNYLNYKVVPGHYYGCVDVNA
jgi:hypothetical protein